MFLKHIYIFYPKKNIIFFKKQTCFQIFLKILVCAGKGNCYDCTRRWILYCKVTNIVGYLSNNTFSEYIFHEPPCHSLLCLILSSWYTNITLTRENLHFATTQNLITYPTQIETCKHCIYTQKIT